MRQHVHGTLDTYHLFSPRLPRSHGSLQQRRKPWCKVKVGAKSKYIQRTFDKIVARIDFDFVLPFPSLCFLFGHEQLIYVVCAVCPHPGRFLGLVIKPDENDRRLFLSILTLNHVNSRSDWGSPMKCDRLRFVQSVLPGKNLPAFPRMQQALLGRSMTQELGTTPSPKRIFMPPVRSVSNLVSSRAYQRGTCAQSDAFV